MPAKLPVEEMLRRRRERKKRYHATHAKERAAYNKRWVAEHRERKRANNARWDKKNRKRRNAYNRQWRARNLERNRATMKKSAQRIEYRLASSLRARLRSVLKWGSKSAATFALIGCDLNFLRGYLEARFKLGMKWSNYGTVWEIDHRIPCASYDLTDPSHQRSCFHYSNLQPMFKGENQSKGARLPEPHQAELL